MIMIAGRHKLIVSFRFSDLGLLKRDRKLQVRYDAWAKGIKEEYGSTGTSIILPSCAAVP
jgi:hypothetical protein